MTIKLKILLILIVLITGCATGQSNMKSSVVEYLYPSSVKQYVEPSKPHLSLPLRVGIAFVPENKPEGGVHSLWSGKTHSPQLAEAEKHQLLEKVADNFRDLEFVTSIDVIPSAYLRPRGSFTNLDQISTMYGIDVIALVSYDQVQFTDENFLSLSYWTLVGTYLVSGEENDTNTLMDTVVYDIESQKMLFRAPGTSMVKGTATPVNLSEKLRQDSVTGFHLAADDMIVNLNEQLALFQERVKDSPQQVSISRLKDYSGGGGGAIGLLSVLVLFLSAYKRRHAS